MPKLPLIVVWVSVMCGYLPFHMGYAFLNPLVIVGYGFFGLLIGAHVREPLRAMGGALGTTWLALLVVNLVAGAPFWVFPPWPIVAVNTWLAITGSLVAQRVPAIVARGIFAVLGAFVIFSGYLPYGWKVWIGEHTTDPDLIVFGAVCGTLFVGTWRLRR